jgi:carbonic anhydrase
MKQQLVSTANPYIHQIRRSLQQAQHVAVDWLVLAHNDARMLKQLDEAFSGGVMAVIALPQGGWQVDDKAMTEAVEWAVEELGVKGVLLVGHSQGGAPEGPVKLLGGKSGGLTGGRPAAAPCSLIDRIKSAQSRAAHVQSQFAEQVERLSRLIRNQVQLHGLFYRGESGVFCVYDRRQRSFRPLLDEAAAA